MIQFTVDNVHGIFRCRRGAAFTSYPNRPLHNELRTMTSKMSAPNPEVHPDNANTPTPMASLTDVYNPPHEEIVHTTVQRSRLKWELISAMQGNNKLVHPFLLKKVNWMDDMLVRTMIVEQPFAAPYGKQGGAWKACAAAILHLLR